MHQTLPRQTCDDEYAGNDWNAGTKGSGSDIEVHLNMTCLTWCLQRLTASLCGREYEVISIFSDIHVSSAAAQL